MNDSGCPQDRAQDLKGKETFLACMLRTDSSGVGRRRGRCRLGEQLGWW